MKKYLKKTIAAVLILLMLAVPVRAVDEISQTSAGLSALGGKPGRLLAQGEEFPAGTSVCDWTAMALALTGSAEDFESYRRALQSHVENAYAETGGVDEVKSTTYHRIALTVLALGGDPTAFGTKPDGTPIDLIADGTYAFAGDSLGMQGLNGWIYALMALDASGAAVPAGAKFTREEMVEAIVSAQEPDGGFGLAPGSSDVDITAMALQALAPDAPDHTEAVDAALSYLAGAMDENCRYTAYGNESAESSAQVILALCALGIDPAEDERFCRGNSDLLTGLEAFRQPDGTYAHTPADGAGDHLATAQTLLALRAVRQLRTGHTWIFDFADYEGPRQKNPSTLWYLTGAAVIVCIVIIGKRRRHGKNN